MTFRQHAVCLIACLAVGGSVPVYSQPLPSYREPLAGSRQLLLVRTPLWESASGLIRAYVRMSEDSAWEPVGEEAALTLGAKGLAWGRGLHGEAFGDGPVKSEGDMTSPAGVFPLGAVFGLASREAGSRFAMPYIALDSTVECVDDPRSRYYNLIVDRRTVSEVDWKTSERMRRVGDDYAWGVVVEHNRDPRVPGKGSCIFIHVRGGPTKPTEGCTSLDEGRLLKLLEWLRPDSRPVLVQLPEAKYRGLKAAWKLP